MKISAAVSRGADSPFVIEQLDLEDPRPDEVLVRVTAVGICHTDLIAKQFFPAGAPAVFGHEGAGVVEKTGSAVRGVTVGDHVLVSYSSCRKCAQCRSEMPAYCAKFAALNSSGGREDGSSPLSVDGTPVAGSFFGQSTFATHALVAARNVVVVAKELDLTATASFGCGAQTGAGAVANVLRPGPSDSVAVFGVGGVGMAAVMAAAALGVRTVCAIDLSKERLDVAAQVGATVTLDGAADGLLDQIRAATGGGATHALDTTAVPAVITNAIAALAPRGTLVLVGVGAPAVELDVLALVASGKAIRGCIEGNADPQTFIPLLIEWHTTVRFPIEKIVRTYPFTEINRAVTDAAAGSAIKPVLTFG